MNFGIKNRDIMSALNKIDQLNLGNVEHTIGKSTTNGEQLNKLGQRLLGNKFKGIYSDGERLPHLDVGEGLIINRKPNEHWVSMANVDGKIYTYDSFNRRPYLGGHQSMDFDGKPDQKDYQSDCGQRALAMLLTVMK